MVAFTGLKAPRMSTSITEQYVLLLSNRWFMLGRACMYLHHGAPNGRYDADASVKRVANGGSLGTAVAILNSPVVLPMGDLHGDLLNPNRGEVTSDGKTRSGKMNLWIFYGSPMDAPMDLLWISYGSPMSIATSYDKLPGMVPASHHPRGSHL